MITIDGLQIESPRSVHLINNFFRISFSNAISLPEVLNIHNVNSAVIVPRFIWRSLNVTSTISVTPRGVDYKLLIWLGGGAGILIVCTSVVVTIGLLLKKKKRKKTIWQVC
jgi:hypothetical protein